MEKERSSQCSSSFVLTHGWEGGTRWRVKSIRFPFPTMRRGSGDDDGAAPVDFKASRKKPPETEIHFISSLAQKRERASEAKVSIATK